MEASAFILRDHLALGDLFALATAEAVETTPLVSGDDDYHEVSDVPKVSVRTST